MMNIARRWLQPRLALRTLSWTRPATGPQASRMALRTSAMLPKPRACMVPTVVPSNVAVAITISSLLITGVSSMTLRSYTAKLPERSGVKVAQWC